MTVLIASGVPVNSTDKWISWVVEDQFGRPAADTGFTSMTRSRSVSRVLMMVPSSADVAGYGYRAHPSTLSSRFLTGGERRQPAVQSNMLLCARCWRCTVLKDALVVGVLENPHVV